MDVVSLYRQLHAMPEVSGEEHLTSRYIERALEQAGYAPRRIGATGVYADLVSDRALPWLVLRADMDALPVKENSCAVCPSERDGVMHACGHDAHCAMLLAAAAGLRGQALPQNIRFVFQPAEETTRGAAELIAAEVMPQVVCACFGMHVWPGIARGVVATRAGALMASSDVYQIRIRGTSAHCAQREKGADALSTAVQIAARLPAIEEEVGHGDAVLFCGSIHSGGTHNVVPDEASMTGTLRTYSAAVRRDIKVQLEQTAADAAARFGTTAQVIWDGGCPVLHNDGRLIDCLRVLVPELCDGAAPTLAAEDFACYLEHAPGVMLWLGIGDTPALHNEAFYVPEQILPDGVALWMKLASWDWKGE